MKLDEALPRKLADWRPDGRQSLIVSDEGSGWSAALTADRCDQLGCLLWEATFRRTGPAPAGATLSAWAERVAHRVTGLLEPLKLVEIDEPRNEALLRSQEPTRRGNDQFYCELLLQGTHTAHLRRYRAARPGDRRDQIAFALTHEALAKLAVDCTTDG